MDTHQTELYKCRLSVCLGEAASLQTLHQGVSYKSDEFNRTMSAAERANPIQLDTCREGHTGRLCQVSLAFMCLLVLPTRVRRHTPSWLTVLLIRTRRHARTASPCRASTARSAAALPTPR
jgi:hypothetical protein